MVDRYLIYFATRQGLAPGALDLLAASDPFAPTDWTAEDGGKAAPFDAAAVSGALAEGAQLELLRRKSPRYTGYLAQWSGDLGHLKLTLDDPADARTGAALFALADALANRLKPEYGLVHAWRKGSPNQAYRLSGNMTLYDLQKTGPRPVCARTWIGPHILSLDMAGFIAEEAAARRTEWGGRVIDLAETPWTADEDALADRQRALMLALAPTGLWGSYGAVIPRPGPNWKPVGDSPL